MASRSRASSAPARPADLSAEQLHAGIPKLERRIADLDSIKPENISEFSSEASSVANRINARLLDIFGIDTIEYKTYEVSWSSLVRMTIGGTPRHLEVEAFERGVNSARRKLQTAIDVMRERLDDVSSGSESGRPLRAYEGLDLHPEISRAASDLYRDGHYANAIEDAVKAINALVRMRSGVELDGTALMQTVFSPKAPVLCFNDLQDQSDRDEQQGFMMMFAGAVAGLRNPRAHKLIKDDPERALEFIAFVSLLAKLLDGAKKTRS